MNVVPREEQTHPTVQHFPKPMQMQNYIVTAKLEALRITIAWPWFIWINHGQPWFMWYVPWNFPLILGGYMVYLHIHAQPTWKPCYLLRRFLTVEPLQMLEKLWRGILVILKIFKYSSIICCTRTYWLKTHILQLVWLEASSGITKLTLVLKLSGVVRWRQKSHLLHKWIINFCK